MSEATSKTCAECGGRGFRGVKGGLCATCNGTGIVTTGEVVGVLPSTPEPSCALCGDTGTVHFQGGDENCAACHARLVLDTEPPLPSTPDPVKPGELPSQTITVTHNGAATAPFPDRYIGPQPDTPTRNGTCDHCGGRGKVLGPLDEIQTCGVCDGTGDEWIPKSILDSAPRLHVECACDECAKPRDATGHDGCIRGLERANATIAEQAAEIERLKDALTLAREQYGQNAGDVREALLAVDRLKDERDTLRNALEIAAARSDSQSASIAYFEQESASHDAALGELTTDRDTLRLEVQRLKDLSFEAQDRYAALEAERDALKERVDGLEKLHGKWADGSLMALEAERDELRLEVARLRDRLLQSLAEGGADQAEAERQVCTLADELAEANARAEAYLRVIEAQNDAIVARIQCHETEIAAAIAASEAGLSLARDPKEADHD